MLKQNGLLVYQGVTRWLGGPNGMHRVQWDRNVRNKVGGEGITVSRLAAVPTGNRHPSALILAFRPGALASTNYSVGLATATATIIDGRNIAGTSDGIATATATLQLVVSGQGTADGVATVSGNVNAALAAAGTSNGVGAVTGTMQALAWASAITNGTSTTSLVSYATGRLVGAIAPAVTLEAASFSTYLLDEEDVETGMTLRQALKLVTAATAGKISGASGTTITIRNAVADSKDRITATVDVDGNRTAITYDLT